MALPLVALASAGVSLIESGLNFIQAGAQKRKANEAADKASRAFDQALNLIEPNYLENVALPLEAFEQERLSGLMGTQQIVQAGQEGEERGAIATAGRAALSNQQAQARARQGLAATQFALDKAVAAEDARIAGVKSGLRQEEAKGFQAMAADARQAQQQQMASGAQGLVSTGAAALKSIPLFNPPDPNQTNVLGFNTGDTFDPTNASFEKTERVFNPSQAARFFGAQLPSVSNITTEPVDDLIFDEILPTADPTIRKIN